MDVLPTLGRYFMKRKIRIASSDVLLDSGSEDVEAIRVF